MCRTQYTPSPALPPDVPSATDGSLGERPAPIRLQYLHRRLRMKPSSTVGMPSGMMRPVAYGIPTRRIGLRLVGAFQQLGRIVCHASSAGPAGHRRSFRRPHRALVALHLRQRFLQVLTLDHRFHRWSSGRRAFETGFRPARFGLRWPNPVAETRRRPSEIRPTRPDRRPAGFTTPALDGPGLRDLMLACQVGHASLSGSYPSTVACSTLLSDPTSRWAPPARRLPFANPSPPPELGKGLHLQSIDYGTHEKARGDRPRAHGITAFCFPKYR
jgi:hypothetical protein